MTEPQWAEFAPRLSSTLRRLRSQETALAVTASPLRATVQTHTAVLSDGQHNEYPGQDTDRIGEALRLARHID